jgi:hypothetical protein
VDAFDFPDTASFISRADIAEDLEYEAELNADLCDGLATYAPEGAGTGNDLGLEVSNSPNGVLNPTSDGDSFEDGVGVGFVRDSRRLTIAELEGPVESFIMDLVRRFLTITSK